MPRAIHTHAGVCVSFLNCNDEVLYSRSRLFGEYYYSGFVGLYQTLATDEQKRDGNNTSF